MSVENNFVYIVIYIFTWYRPKEANEGARQPLESTINSN
jgi:hypothetical protein